MLRPPGLAILVINAGQPGKRRQLSGQCLPLVVLVQPGDRAVAR